MKQGAPTPWAPKRGASAQLKCPVENIVNVAVFLTKMVTYGRPSLQLSKLK
jgi:hypothetical protein